MLPLHEMRGPEPRLENTNPVHMSLAQPLPSLLGKYLQTRLESEQNPGPEVSLPAGVRVNLRPSLPRISMASLMLYTNRKAVDSYPLIYNTLALAHPN